MLFSETSGLPLGLGASESFPVADLMEMKVEEGGVSLPVGKTRGRPESSLSVSCLLVEGAVETA